MSDRTEMIWENDIVVPKACFLYPYLFKEKPAKGEYAACYQLWLRIPKTDKTFIAKMEKIIKSFTARVVAEVYDGVMPRKGIETPFFMDCDISDKEFIANNPEIYEGHYLLRLKCNTNIPPQVINVNGDEIIDSSKIYAGCVGQACFSLFNYDVGQPGISAKLAFVKKLADGEPIASSGQTTRDAKSVFDEQEEDDELA